MDHIHLTYLKNMLDQSLLIGLSIRVTANGKK